METKRGQNTYGKHSTGFIDVLLIMLLLAVAAMVGIRLGNMLYKLNVNIIEKVDADNFKQTISLSFPIIDTVYNSGKSSVSIAREIKGLFSGIFGFDLESPVTILNAQSPVFMEYYNRVYRQKKISEEDDTVKNKYGYVDKQQDAGNPDNGETGSGSGKGPGAGEETGNEKAGREDGNMSQDGQPNHGTDQTGKPGGSGDGTNNTKVPGSDGQSTGSGIPGNQEGAGKTGGSSQADFQPVSSIAYEVEEDDDEEKSDTVATDKIVIRNFTKHKIDIEKLLEEPIKLEFSRKGPKVLVYHTHTTESYVPKESDLGKKDVPSFSNDPRYSVVRVGEELARHLKKYGIETLHNGTVHDKVRDAAYGVSINTLNSYKKSYPSIKVFIDVHRDGLAADKPKLRLTKKINGKDAAQIMFVVGTDGMLPHPGWKENLKFVLRLQQKLNEKYPGLARPVWVVGKRYNQHISDQAILVEIGGDGNLLEECLESARYLAEVLNDVMMEGK
ncbi:MAG: stage II sporulation protein P [Acetivibrionales bacterium]|jgi:stage II sporulation protein P